MEYPWICLNGDLKKSQSNCKKCKKWHLEGPKSTLIVNRNIKRSENSYENCYYLERSKVDVNSLLVVTVDTQKGPWIVGNIVIP